MPTFLHRNEINDKKWNALASDFLFGQTAYLDAMCENWNGLVMGDYEFALPVPSGKKWCLHYAYQPYFIQSFRILAADKEVSPELVTRLLNALKKHYFKFDLCLQFPDDAVKGAWTSHKIPNQVLHLSSSYQTLYENYRPSFKRKLKKVAHLDLKTAYITDHDEIESVFQKFYIDRNLTNPVALNAYFKTLKVLREHNKLEVLGVYKDNVLTNVTILRQTDTNRIGINSINGAQGRELNATARAIDQVIKEKAGQDIVLDFEGSKIESIQHRNHGFGAIDEYYYYYAYRKL